MTQILELKELLASLQLSDVNMGVCDGPEWFGNGKKADVFSPINGQRIAAIAQGNANDFERVVQSAQDAFLQWRICGNSNPPKRING